MEGLVRRYRQSHFEDADFTLVRLMMQGPDDAVADVLWTIRRGAGAPWRFHTGYNLHRTAEGWRILLCTAYDEQRARGDEG